MNILKKRIITICLREVQVKRCIVHMLSTYVVSTKKPHKQKLKGNLISQLSFDSGLRQWRRLLY